jgi:hypothetical protein
VNQTSVDAYERVIIPTASKAMSVFLYALHYGDANYLQVGVGVESASKLQRAHIGGPQVHEAHLPVFVDWLRDNRIMLLSEQAGRNHPFSSNYTVDLNVRLAASAYLPLTIGKYLPLVDDIEVPAEVVRRFADAVERVQIKAYGHPRDWDVRFHELLDGRFVWMAYDDDLKKIRIGMGYYDEANQPVFGVHSYAVNQRDAAVFAAFHYSYLDKPIQFMGLPPRWPSGLNPFLYGPQKRDFSVEFMRLADRVWPGGVVAPT